MTEQNFSDRYLSKTSNTKPSSGNTPKRVADSVRKFGLVDEEVWPMTPTLEEYFKDIPKEILEKGQEFLKEYDYGYEWVDKDKLKEALKRSPVCVAVYAWAKKDGVYYRPEGARDTHYVVLVAYDESDRPVIWDSYDLGLKTLEKDYDFGFPQIYTLKKEVTKEEKSWWQKIWTIIKSIF